MYDLARAFTPGALSFFRQQYLADKNFAATVDAAVLRILTLKLRLYGGAFNSSQAARPVSGLSVLLGDEANERLQDASRTI